MPLISQHIRFAKLLTQCYRHHKHRKDFFLIAFSKFCVGLQALLCERPVGSRIYGDNKFKLITGRTEFSDQSLRERLRTHKVFTKDKCFYLNYHKFSIKLYVLDVY